MSLEDEWNKAKPIDTFDARLIQEGIDPTSHKGATLKAIYSQESSSGKNTNTSNAGAVGGMQIMPNTFNSVANKEWDINNPEHSTRAGIRYGSQLYDANSGDANKTAIGYYGGQNAINKAEQGIAVSDPRNPNAPNTIEYANSITNKMNNVEQDNLKKLWDSSSEIKSTAQANTPQSWLKVATRGVSNLPSSIAGVAGDVVSSVLHPVDTAQGVLDLGNAALQKVLSDAIVKMMPESTRNNPAKLNAVVDFYKSRYTNPENFKEALATDPASVLADFSTVLTGGGSLASKIPALTKVGNVVAGVGRIIDPLSIAVNATPSFGKGLANVIGGTGTHTGAESLKTATRAGTEGGKMSETFLNNLRGNVPMQDVLDMAKQNVADMGATKSQAYQQGMAGISNDKSVLDFNKIDSTLANTYDKVTFKGKPKNDVAFNAFNKIANEIDAWKNLDPAEFHTPMGLDALKQRIGGIQESIPYEEKTARMVAKNLYDSVKNEITNQAPTYSKVMKDYSQASDLINEIERTFSLKQSGNPDTAMRKLQSLMRNNVNTNYGNRLDLFKTLENQGRNELTSAIAGQALNSWTPRGLANAGLTGIGSYAVGGAPLVVPMLMAQSPRLMGEAAYGVGVLSKPVTKASEKLKGMFDYLNVDPTLTGNLLYQARENR